MTVVDVLKLVEQAMAVSVREVKMWYTMKFDQRMMVSVSRQWGCCEHDEGK